MRYEGPPSFGFPFQAPIPRAPRRGLAGIRVDEGDHEPSGQGRPARATAKLPETSVIKAQRPTMPAITRKSSSGSSDLKDSPQSSANTSFCSSADAVMTDITTHSSSGSSTSSITDLHSVTFGSAAGMCSGPLPITAPTGPSSSRPKLIPIGPSAAPRGPRKKPHLDHRWPRGTRRGPLVGLASYHDWDAVPERPDSSSLKRRYETAEQDEVLPAPKISKGIPMSVCQGDKTWSYCSACLDADRDLEASRILQAKIAEELLELEAGSDMHAGLRVEEEDLMELDYV